MTDRQHEFGGLTEILTDIARVPTILRTPAGPNSWDEITSADFGPNEDFTVRDEGSIFIFNAVSNAALQWCYKHLPEDCPRWGARGFAIEHRYIGDIVEGARRDNLMSRADYVEAMEEQNELQNSGVDIDFAEYQLEDR